MQTDALPLLATPAARLRGVLAWAFFVLAAVWAGPAAAAEINVYWERGTYWPGPAFDDFTRQTGVAVNFPVRAEKNEGFERLKAEGSRTEADLFITNNIANLVEAARAGLLAQVESRALNANVPAHLRDPEHRWFGVAVRTRVIVYSPERVKPSELSTYEALGDPKWKGRLCLRTSASPYNQLLLGAWIRRYGEKQVEQVVKGWLANSPLILEKDLYVLKAIAAGKCDVGIAHSYYLARLLVNDPNFPVAPFWPDQQGAGVHVGVAGAGVTAHGRNRADAIKLLEFLTSAENQNAVVDANFEFPVNPNVKPHPVLAKWGPFKLDEVGVAGAADLQAAGGKLAERVGFK